MTDRLMNGGMGTQDDEDLMRRLQEAGAERRRQIEDTTAVSPPVPIAEVEDNPEQKEAEKFQAFLKKQTNLPTPEEQAALKKKFPRYELTVIPLIVETQGKTPSVIVKPLSRAEWRKAQEYATNQIKGTDRPYDEIFMERVVEVATVWPSRSRVEFEAERAGYVPSVYGVVEKISWFFDPAHLLNLTFSL